MTRDGPRLGPSINVDCVIRSWARSLQSAPPHAGLPSQLRVASGVQDTDRNRLGEN